MGLSDQTKIDKTLRHDSKVGWSYEENTDKILFYEMINLVHNFINKSKYVPTDKYCRI